MQSCDPNYRNKGPNEIMEAIEEYADFQQSYGHLIEAFEMVVKRAA